MIAAESRGGMMHLNFRFQIYEYQTLRGCYFLHEHPALASSWGVDRARKLLAMPGVERVVGNRCRFGAEAANGQPIKKPMGFITNFRGISKALSKQCAGRSGACARPQGGHHILCNGRVAVGGTLPDEALSRHPERFPRSAACWRRVSEMPRRLP